MAGDWLAPPLAFRTFFTGYIYYEHPETFVSNMIQISSDFSYVIFWHAYFATFFNCNRIILLQIPLIYPTRSKTLLLALPDILSYKESFAGGVLWNY